MTDLVYEDAGLKRILSRNKRVAVVGLSLNPARPSYEVARYLQNHDFTIIPVNPKYREVLGATCYPDLRSVPGRVGIVNLFRRPEFVGPLVDDAIAVGAKVVWMQLGIVDFAAAARAEAAGLDVVMDRCMKIEHARLFGGRARGR